ncbi:Uncharacterised protein [Collinsella intestinalis]|nr:Uncharacterised protein [Collinsella intestinalis]
MGLGRKGLRVAKTPRRSEPPRRGGRTVGVHFAVVPGLLAVAASTAISAAVPPGVPFSNSQSSHRWLNSSKPATACGSANSGSNTMRPCRCGAKKLLRGMPNFCGRSVSICAMGVISMPAPYPWNRATGARGSS